MWSLDRLYIYYIHIYIHLDMLVVVEVSIFILLILIHVFLWVLIDDLLLKENIEVRVMGPISPLFCHKFIYSKKKK